MSRSNNPSSQPAITVDAINDLIEYCKGHCSSYVCSYPVSSNPLIKAVVSELERDSGASAEAVLGAFRVEDPETVLQEANEQMQAWYARTGARTAMAAYNPEFGTPPAGFWECNCPEEM